MTTWTEHVARWRDCTACPLHRQRSNIVLARAGVVGGATTGGCLPATVVFVGEAPGASEDATGLPFWGPAGDLLQQIVERALPDGTTYAMCNLVCCFPREAKERGDNEPEPGEIKACRPRLDEFIALAAPKLVVLVGRLASDWVQHDAYGLVHGARVVDIVHPAHILRDAAQGGMPRVQKNMAIQKSIVVIRSAVADVLQCG